MVGIDIVEITRIESLCQHHEKRLGKFFTAYELAYSAARKQTRAATLAGIYAAKEAFYKALGTGFREGQWTDVEVKHSDLGAPYFVFYGVYAQRVELYGGTPYVSISHDGAYAIAQVVWWRNERGASDEKA